MQRMKIKSGLQHISTIDINNMTKAKEETNVILPNRNICCPNHFNKNLPSTNISLP